MAKLTKIKSKLSKVDKNVARIWATAGGALLLSLTIGLGIGSKACNSTKIEEETGLNTEPVLTGQAEPDIYTEAPEDTILDDVIFEDQTASQDETINEEWETLHIIPDPGINPTNPLPEDTLEDITTSEDNIIEDETLENETIQTPEIIIPSEDKQEIKSNYQDLITNLNIEIENYLLSKGNKICPTITGVEKVDLVQNNGNYEFTIQLEGAYNDSSISYYNLTLVNNDIEGVNIHDLAEFDIINLNDLLIQLNDLVVAEGTEILSVKNLTQVEIIDPATAIKVVAPELAGSTASQIHAYAMTNVSASKDNYVYENKITINTGTQTQFVVLNITSTTPLKSTQVADYLTQILDGKTVDVKVDIKKGIVLNNKINNYINQVNDIIDESTLSY